MDVLYTIRQGTLKDVDLAVAFRWLMFGDSGKEEAIDHIRQEVRARYMAEYHNGSIVHFFAMNHENEAIASAGALIKSDFPYCLFKPGYYGWIIDVYTKPEYRGNGIARALLEKNHLWLKEKGAIEARLIAVGKKPQELYQKIGYRPTWEMSLSLCPGRNTYNDIITRESRGNGG
ncbi:GNAT family N-acetyltransferase [Treponema sp. TIM-1]|uniref:GNAT family N-acetyltransferase n=1 Tax=Treponema sp. TIM-1 TaxID=2898417 RepID=UPI0039814366